MKKNQTIVADEEVLARALRDSFLVNVSKSIKPDKEPAVTALFVGIAVSGNFSCRIRETSNS